MEVRLLDSGLADGVILSMFDGLFQWRNKPDESQEGGDGRFEWVAFFSEGGYDARISSYQMNTALKDLQFEITAGTYPSNLGFDNIIDEKEYSTSIEITFKDGTNATIKIPSDLIAFCFSPALEIGPGPFQ